MACSAYDYNPAAKGSQAMQQPAPVAQATTKAPLLPQHVRLCMWHRLSCQPSHVPRTCLPCSAACTQRERRLALQFLITPSIG